MDDVLKQLVSPAFWILVVVVGLILNVLSSYLKSGLDVLFTRWSDKRRERSQAEKEKVAQLTSIFVSDRHLQLVHIGAAVGYLVAMTGLMVFTGFSFVFADQLQNLLKDYDTVSNLIRPALYAASTLVVLIMLAGWNSAFDRFRRVIYCVGAANKILLEKSNVSAPDGD